jgi:hypothetical protein
MTFDNRDAAGHHCLPGRPSRQVRIGRPEGTVEFANERNSPAFGCSAEAKPRQQAVMAIAALRGIGKREVSERLKAIKRAWGEA